MGLTQRRKIGPVGARDRALQGARLRPGSGWAPYLFVAPFFILFAAFWVYPVVYSLWLSFQHWSATSSVFLGLANYQRMLTDPAVQAAFGNAIWYLVVNNCFQIPIALAIAVLLNAPRLRGRAPLRAAFFAPNVVSGVVAAIVFQIILGQGGVLSALLGNHIQWLQSTTWAKPAVIVVGGWRWIGYWVVILLAGLQTVPNELVEAARVDGARSIRILFSVTLPLLRPVLLFVLVINSIGTLQIFEEPLLLFPGTVGGPQYAAISPVLAVYRAGFQDFDLGYAAAIGWVLTLMIVVIVIIQMTVLRTREVA